MSCNAKENGVAVREVAEYAANLQFEDLPESAIVRTRQVVLDFLGITVGGRQTPLGNLVADYAATKNAGSQATIIGDPRPSTVGGAAWANATMSCVLGMSETHRKCGHIASEVVPPAVALVEHLGLGGRVLVTALAAGYEVFGAIQPKVRDFQRDRGLDHKGQVGSLGAAVAAGVALRLEPSAMAHALALSVDLACGTEQYTFDAGLCDTEGLTAGFGARNGIDAAMMADFGFRGAPGALDGPYGYLNAFGGGAEWEPNSLGTPSVLGGTGLKPHVGCRHVHPAVDATQQLLNDGHPPIDEIRAIEIGTYRSAVTPSFRVNYDPDSVEAAMYSLPSVVSVVLTRGNWYAEDAAAFNEPEIRRLRSLVTVRVDPEIDANYPRAAGAVVRVITEDGTSYEGRVRHAKGEPENTMTHAEQEAKFRRVVDHYLPEDQITQILQLTSELEDLSDLRGLMQLTFRG